MAALHHLQVNNRQGVPRAEQPQQVVTTTQAAEVTGTAVSKATRMRTVILVLGPIRILLPTVMIPAKQTIRMTTQTTTVTTTTGILEDSVSRKVSQKTIRTHRKTQTFRICRARRMTLSLTGTRPAEEGNRPPSDLLA